MKCLTPERLDTGTPGNAPERPGGALDGSRWPARSASHRTRAVHDKTSAPDGAADYPASFCEQFTKNEMPDTGTPDTGTPGTDRTNPQYRRRPAGRTARVPRAADDVSRSHINIQTMFIQNTLSEQQCSSKKTDQTRSPGFPGILRRSANNSRKMKCLTPERLTGTPPRDTGTPPGRPGGALDGSRWPARSASHRTRAVHDKTSASDGAADYPASCSE
jgi:hypothetical protein